MVVWSRVWDGPELLEGGRGTIHLCGVNAAARWIPFVCLSDDGTVLAHDCSLNGAALSMRLLGPCWVGPVRMVDTCVFPDKEATSYGGAIQVGIVHRNLSGRRQG